MNNSEYNFIYGKYLDLFNSYSEKVFSTVETSTKLAEAMKYSLFAGGKRIRPVLMLAFTDILGGRAEDILPFALSLECIHTYSLIHDDLPSLDNDVLRRGKPTCHVAFDESTAILAGDALLNFAFEHSLNNSTCQKDIKALYYLAQCSGYKGMLGGQQLDIESQSVLGDEKLLHEIHDKKTCKLLTAPFVIPAIKFDFDNLAILEEFGNLLGLIFQFTDDVLDLLSSEEKLGKSIGKDEKSNKFTSVKLYGLQGVKDTISNFALKLENIAKSLDNTGFLQCFINNVVGRINEN